MEGWGSSVEFPSSPSVNHLENYVICVECIWWLRQHLGRVTTDKNSACFFFFVLVMGVRCFIGDGGLVSLHMSRGMSFELGNTAAYKSNTSSWYLIVAPRTQCLIIRLAQCGSPSRR
jgi:hypothetical protein